MFLAFGEIMLRLAADGFGRLRQSLPGRLAATFGGGEANVCVSLAMLGAPARYMTALPKNGLADCLLATLRSFGIDVGHVLIREGGRLGIYFLETGANQRASNVIYDRQGSAISEAAAEEYGFEAALGGVRWVHVTGITPSLSEKAFAATLRLVRLAKGRGATVSCDLNFRKKLWRWKAGKKPNELAGECMSQILPHVDVVIGNEEDAADVLGIAAEGTSVQQGRLNPRAYETVARSIVKRFPNVAKVAITLRESISASHNNWGGMLFDAAAGKAFFAPLDAEGDYRPYEIRNIVDRVGGGDSFAAGLLYALDSKEYAEAGQAIRFAVANSCLKHSIVGDFSYVPKEEVLALMKGDASGRVKR